MCLSTTYEMAATRIRIHTGYGIPSQLPAPIVLKEFPRFEIGRPWLTTRVSPRAATIIPEDKKDKEPHKVSDLQPLYRLADGRLKLLPTLMFRKTVKLDVAKIQKLHQVEGTPADAPEFQLTLKDGAEHTLTLLKSIDLDGQKMTLEGLVGKVPAGFKLFPIHTIADVPFDEEK